MNNLKKYSKYLFYSFLITISVFLNGCSKKYIPTESVIKLSSSWSNNDAITSLKNNAYLPPMYTADLQYASKKEFFDESWKNGDITASSPGTIATMIESWDSKSFLTLSNDGYIFNNLFRLGKFIKYEGYNKVYEIERYNLGPIKYYEIKKIVSAREFYDNYCYNNDSLLILYKTSFDNFSICVKNIDNFYSAAIKLMPNADIVEQ